MNDVPNPSPCNETDLLEEEMIGQMIQHHRILFVVLIGAREFSHAGANRFGCSLVQLENRQTNESPDTFRIDLRGTFER
jgi:hypothetical protein